MFRRRLAWIALPALLFGSVAPAWALTPNDTFFTRQWYLPQIKAGQAWDVTTGSQSVVVAVIDTAMDIDHEDLKENIWTNTRETFGNGVDDDGNGYIDDVHGWNFVAGSNDVRPRSSGATEQGLLHGTLVASLLAARGNNDIGIAGVAWQIRIMPLVALDASGNGSTEDVARAIHYAADHGASIINLSMEGYTDAPELDEALSYARSRGVLTVAAAGNSDDPQGADLDVLPVYPVCLSNNSLYGVIGVGSTNREDDRARYADYGSCVDVSAPGDDIFGAQVTIDDADGKIVSGYGGGFSGTSLAAPLVAGTAALLKSVRPDWGWSTIRDRIMATADLMIEGTQGALAGKLGTGRLNVAAALESLTAATNSGSWQALASRPLQQTSIRMTGAAGTAEIAPFGNADVRGAHTAFVDVDADGIPEIVAVPASGTTAEWAMFDHTGRERARGTLATNVKEGLLIVGTGDGIVMADPAGGRAWGMTIAALNGAGAATVFYPYGALYGAGLDVAPVPSAVAFAPRSGGGHVLVTDVAGRRLVSAFPFGKDVRGHWSVARMGGSGGQPASLLFSGPSGSAFLDMTRLSGEGWQHIGLAALEQEAPIGSEGISGSVPGFLLQDQWPRF